ncbi:transposase YhgA-like protein [Candidatus Moduliflexus flocculans]|uniref:Transposase YhgA-like protein n=1 Tax=Candidatus Moduliflexus flocculans TaxID=1499966 RepID=A0A081BSI3_9BACT|nr:transposase YhgA-like protein [Candidatus Moduliflexus flocculans]
MGDIANPHDKLFRETWSNRAFALDFLRNYLPDAVLQRINLESLNISKDSFVDPALKEFHSDLLYLVNFSGQAGYVYLLFEHKSYPEKYIHLQLMEYLLKIWRLHLKQQPESTTLPQIIPLVLYHGQRHWTMPLNFSGTFGRQEHLLTEYIPTFEYVLIDLSRYSDKEIRGSVMSRVALLLLKHIFDADIEQRLPAILSLLRDLLDKTSGLQYLETLLRYVASATDNIKKEQIVKIVEKTFEAMEGRNVVMTLAEQWIQEGFEKGFEKGVQYAEKQAEIGKKQGYCQGLLEGMNLVLRFRFGSDAATLMPVLQTIQDPETLKKIEQGFEQAQHLAEIKALIEQYRAVPQN